MPVNNILPYLFTRDTNTPAFAAKISYATSTESNRPHFLQIPFVRRNFRTQFFPENCYFVELTPI